MQLTTCGLHLLHSLRRWQAITIPTISLDTLMSFILDRLLDDLWLPICAREFVRPAANVAFVLAFVTVLSSDDAATVASGKRKR